MGRVKRKSQKRSVNKSTQPSAPEIHTEFITPASSSRRTTTTEFNPDYSYVIKDLKTIGVLAVSFTALLVILSFFLR